MTLYDVLGAPRDADHAELRRAYRAAVRGCHPDRDASPAAARRFEQVREAWHILGDEQRRAAYDARYAAVVFVRRRARLARLRRWLRGRPKRTLR